MSSPAFMEYGITTSLLLIMWKMLEVAKTIYLNKRIDQPVATLACQTDPMHFLRIQEMHEQMGRTQQAMDRGELGCRWKNRDEVSKSLELSRVQISASKQQTVAIIELTAELRRTRNGD